MANLAAKKPPGFLARWADVDPFSALHDEMESLFARFAGNDKLAELSPSLDLTEENGAYQIKMDAPGMKVEDIQIDVAGDAVTISGERKEEKEEKGERRHRIERRFGSFSRMVRLPCAVKEDKVEAELKEGVLTLKLPKCDEAKGKKVKIKAT